MRGAKGASATNQEGATWTSNCRDRGLACGHSEDPTEAARAPERLWVLTACPHFFGGKKRIYIYIYKDEDSHRITSSEQADVIKRLFSLLGSGNS